MAHLVLLGMYVQYVLHWVGGVRGSECVGVVGVSVWVWWVSVCGCQCVSVEGVSVYVYMYGEQ